MLTVGPVETRYVERRCRSPRLSENLQNADHIASVSAHPDIRLSRAFVRHVRRFQLSKASPQFGHSARLEEDASAVTGHSLVRPSLLLSSFNKQVNGCGHAFAQPCGGVGSVRSISPYGATITHRNVDRHHDRTQCTECCQGIPKTRISKTDRDRHQAMIARTDGSEIKEFQV